MTEVCTIGPAFKRGDTVWRTIYGDGREEDAPSLAQALAPLYAAGWQITETLTGPHILPCLILTRLAP